MPRRDAGYNHVLAAIADAIHAGQSYKGKGKGASGKGSAKGQQWTQTQDGRNCPNCGDYNFGFRTKCRQCAANLPPARLDAAGQKSTKGQKGATKGNGQTASGWNGAGKGTAAESSENQSTTTGGATPAAKTSAEEAEQQDPAERVREIRAEEEKLRRSRAQFAESNPRMLEAIDRELESLAAEREKLQPLEVNLQAAAGRTAHARAFLAKAKERKVQAAKELRTCMDKYRNADKEVAEAEAKLSAAEAAATAKRTEVKLGSVQDAVELLRKTATDKCGDSAVSAQVASALQQIADLLGAITTPSPGMATGGDGGGQQNEQAAEGPSHPVFAVCGATDGKTRRTLPPRQHPAAHAVSPGGGGDNGGGGVQQQRNDGGPHDGDVVMEAAPSNADEGADDLLSQAAAALADEENAAEL